VWPVYDCAEENSEAGPPGQYRHFPCGHSFGEVIMIATGETPEAVRTGFRWTTSITSSRASVGAWSKISVFFGTFGEENFEQASSLADSRSSRSISPARIRSTRYSQARTNASGSSPVASLPDPLRRRRPRFRRRRHSPRRYSLPSDRRVSELSVSHRENRPVLGRRSRSRGRVTQRPPARLAGRRRVPAALCDPRAPSARGAGARDLRVPRRGAAR